MGRILGALAAGTVVAGLIGLIVVGLAGRGGVATSAALPPAPPAAAELVTAAPPAKPEAKELVVDVAGAVQRPGLVHLRVGARVADAVAAAGGSSADAELVGLNQARVVADGEQVRVPRAGEAPVPAAAGPSGVPPGGPSGPVDLNRSTLAELDVLPGVGPATAAAIISWREKNGGFRRVDDLLEVPGIGPSRLERLRSLVRV